VSWMCWISAKSWWADVAVAVGVRGGVAIAVDVGIVSLESGGCTVL